MPGSNSAASSKFPHPGSPARPPLAPRGAKSKRLLKHADFQLVYQNGRRQFTGNMTVFFLRRPNEAVSPVSPRVGLTVGKVLGGAVERNRIKRRMREAVRQSFSACEGPIDVVFNPRKSVLTLPFAELLNEVKRGLLLATQRARHAEPKKTEAK
jgi:ribonuclease P protein component